MEDKKKQGPEGEHLLLQAPSEKAENGKDSRLKDSFDGDRDDDVTAKCGVGTCAPEALQPCADVRAFTANASAMLLSNVCQYTYFVGTVRTIEKRFGLSSTEANLSLSVFDLVSTVMVLFIAFLGQKLHKPRAIAFANVIVGIGVLFYGMPYLLYGAKDAHISSSAIAGFGNSSVGDGGATQQSLTLCRPLVPTGDNISTAEVCGLQVATENVIMATSKRGAFICIIFGAVLMGLGATALVTLAIPYVDENVKSENSPVHVGIFTSMHSWSPIVGFMLAALCTRLPENLTGTTDLTPSDPGWIGAWWLGYFIFGIFVLLTSVPMFFFPKHFQHYYIGRKKLKKKPKEAAKSRSVIRYIKDWPRHTWGLLSNSAYVTLVLSYITGFYVVAGMYSSMPKYMEIHFKLPAYMASLIAGGTGAVVAAIGNIIGGLIMKRFKFGIVGSARMYVAAVMVGVAGSAIKTALGCEQTMLHGEINPGTNRLSVEESCNTACGCTLERLQPVCVNNTINYMSACHAGCTGYVAQNMTYNDCGCAGSGVSVSTGFCGESSCATLLPYILVFVIASFLGAIAKVPATMLMLRIVRKEDKAYAIGMQTFAVNLLCFVPGPIFYGKLYDSACLLWQETCGNRGACLLYDTRLFRLYMHGVTLCFQVASLFFGICCLVFVTRKVRRGGIGSEDEGDVNFKSDQ